jgi:hypothetical protein
MNDKNDSSAPLNMEIYTDWASRHVRRHTIGVISLFLFLVYFFLPHIIAAFDQNTGPTTIFTGEYGVKNLPAWVELLAPLYENGFYEVLFFPMFLGGALVLIFLLFVHCLANILLMLKFRISGALSLMNYVIAALLVCVTFSFFLLDLSVSLDAFEFLKFLLVYGIMTCIVSYLYYRILLFIASKRFKFQS